MSILQIAILGILGLFALAGLLIGFIKGAVKATIRALVVVACIVVAVLFNAKITEFVYGININGQTLKEMLMGLLDGVDVQGIDPQQIKDILWPIVLLLSQIIVCIVSVIGLLTVSWVLVLIIDIIAKIFLKGKKKFRLIGGLIGLLSGAVVGFSVTSLVTGLVPNIYAVYSLEIGDIKLSEQIPIPADLIESLGIATFNEEEGGIVYKVGALANPLVYDRVSTATIVDDEGNEITYTFDGQIEMIKNLASLVGTLMELQDIDFTSMESVDDIADALKKLDELDFANMDEGTKATLDNLIQVGIEASGFELPEGVEINVETLAAVDFGAVGECVNIVGEIQNGGEIPQEEVAGVLKSFLTPKEGCEQSTIDVINSFGLDISGFTADPEVAGVVNSSIGYLESLVDDDGNPEFTEAEINTLRELLFGSAE